MKKRLLGLILACVLAVSGTAAAWADEEDDIRNAKTQAENQLNETNSTLDALAEQQEAIQSQISDINADLVDKMVQISQAEQDITSTQQMVDETQAQIDATRTRLDEENALKDRQYDDMVRRIQYIYENGGQAGWVTLLLKAGTLSGLLNRIEYVNALQQADRTALDDYEETIASITEEESLLETQKAELEAQQSNLELQEEALQTEKDDLETQLAEAQETNDDYASQITEAKEQASQIEGLIAQQQAELERIEEEKAAEAARKAAEEAARAAAEEAARAAANSGGDEASSNGSSSGTSSSSGSSSSRGSSTGQQIVDYALQYVGYPYVWGGSSLTNGVDCSHFVWLVLRNCGVYSGGYMTSGYWAYAGTPVASLAEAQAGDVIVYSGHVAFYDGNGLLVEAKGAAYGITHDRRADSRPIVAIRRFV